VIKHLILYISILTLSYGYSQTKVYGKVTDDLSRPLVGAEVKISGVKQKYYTNSKGEFTLFLSSGLSYTLRIGSVNHYAKKRTVNVRRSEINLGTISLKVIPSGIIVVETESFDGPIERIKPPPLGTVPSGSFWTWCELE